MDLYLPFVIFYIFFNSFLFQQYKSCLKYTVYNWLALRTAHLLCIIPTNSFWTKNPTKNTSVQDGQTICQKHQPITEKECTAAVATSCHRLADLTTTVCQTADETDCWLSAKLVQARDFTEYFDFQNSARLLNRIKIASVN